MKIPHYFSVVSDGEFGNPVHFVKNCDGEFRNPVHKKPGSDGEFTIPGEENAGVHPLLSRVRHKNLQADYFSLALANDCASNGASLACWDNYFNRTRAISTHSLAKFLKSLHRFWRVSIHQANLK